MKNNEYTNKLEELSVFFPCFNEEANIGKLLDQALDIIPKYAQKYEIIIVNDGSTDDTSKISHEYSRKHPEIRVIDHKKNSGGYGGAVKTGFESVRYKWFFFTDADLQFDLKEIDKFISAAIKENPSDLIIGYRKKRAEGFKRQILASGMKIWSRVFLGYPMFIKDTDCAFKLIKKEVIDNIGTLHSNSNLITTELLLRAHRKKYKFEQIGVNHYLRHAGESTCGGSKAIIHVIKDTMSLVSVFYGIPIKHASIFLYAKFKAIMGLDSIAFDSD